MAEVFSNNAASTIVGSLGASDLSVTVATGHGTKFPTLSGADFFRVVMVNRSTGGYEIAKVTGHSAGSTTLSFGDLANRGIEGTTALAFEDNDIIELRPTAGFFQSMATDADIQEQSGNYQAATGTGGNYAVTLSPVPTGYAAGMVVRFKANHSNTGAVTLDVNGLGAQDVRKNVSDALSSGDIASGAIVTVVYDGTNFQMIGVLPSTQLSLTEGSAPAGVANKASLFAVQDGSTRTVLGAVDSAGNAARVVVLPAGTKQTFNQASAPPGWTIDTSFDGRALFVKGTFDSGAVAGGTTGGTDAPDQMDKVPQHQHADSFSVASGGDHTHPPSGGTVFLVGNGGGSNGFGGGGYSGVYRSTTGSGGSHGHTLSGSVGNVSGATAANWAPKYATVIVGTLQ